SHRALSEHKTLSISWSHYRQRECTANNITFHKNSIDIIYPSTRTITYINKCIYDSRTYYINEKALAKLISINQSENINLLYKYYSNNSKSSS
ncbi:hypothetical protein, partial [Escherichia sp. MOD1-EC5457]|uniref:hypothetical protein n=1 Tax=Escherichia sp. MOD1-EC5457 TaxID=2093874 RepID=UPI001A7E0D8B